MSYQLSNTVSSGIAYVILLLISIKCLINHNRCDPYINRAACDIIIFLFNLFAYLSNCISEVLKIVSR